MDIGKRIRRRRQALNITQLELAGRLQVTHQHISVVEQEKRLPSLGFLLKLAEELGVTTDYLLSGKESIITDTIPAIKADKSLTLKAKKLLIGLVEELHFDESRHHYEVKPSAEHHHLVCLGCGSVIEFQHPLSRYIKRNVPESRDFNIAETEIRVAGYCPRCRQKLK